MLRMLDLLVKNRTTFTQMLQRVDQQLESVVIKNDISETIKEF
jgi:3-deoxy-D-arabino-heptulosonate 7-phosphate (DAHP) synthase